MVAAVDREDVLRFSIREMLALTFLAVLAMLVWRSWRDAQFDQARLETLRNEVASLEATARVDHPAVHQAMLNTRDEFEPLQAMRQRAVEHFDLLLRKYSTIDPPPADTLALRIIPTLQVGRDPAPVIYRLVVPTQRPVWLKIGVSVAQDKSGSSSAELDEDRVWLHESPLSLSGPFELQLKPGDQRLKIYIGSADESSMPVQVMLNDQVLLDAVFAASDPAHKSVVWASPKTQVNYGPHQPLEHFFSVHLEGLHPTSQAAPPVKYELNLWLSDRPSGFSRFPSSDLQ